MPSTLYQTSNTKLPIPRILCQAPYTKHPILSFLCQAANASSWGPIARGRLHLSFLVSPAASQAVLPYYYNNWRHSRRLYSDKASVASDMCIYINAYMYMQGQWAARIHFACVLLGSWVLDSVVGYSFFDLLRRTWECWRPTTSSFWS